MVISRAKKLYSDVESPPPGLSWGRHFIYTYLMAYADMRKWIENNGHPRHTHGYATGMGQPEYGVWNAMRQRCSNPKNRAYKNYGGRGIRVCERWLYFANFIEDVGPRPSKSHSLDRIDNNGDYEPDNVRWATLEEQNLHKRVSRLITYNGKTQPLFMWAKETGLDRLVIHKRLKRGWSIERALTQEVTL